MILVCGEALIDVFSTPSQGNAIAMEGHVGGSPFNVALGSARLGRRSSFFAGISTDFFGQRLCQVLSDEGVSLSLVKRSARPSPLSFVSVGAEGLVSYSCRNEGAADHDLLPADLPAELSEEIACIAVGSYTLGLDPAGETVTLLAEREASSRVISFDPNMRPDLIADEAIWRERFERILRVATIVKISMEDVGHVFGPGADVDAMAQGWLAGGVALVLVTDGPQPVRAYGAFGEVRHEAPAVEVVDTVGAGDSFHAALLSFIEREGRMTREALHALDVAFVRQALDFAARAAAITCSRRGADLPRAAELA